MIFAINILYIYMLLYDNYFNEFVLDVIDSIHACIFVLISDVH